MSTAARRIPFPEAARPALADAQLRRNLGHATRTIRAKRAGVVEELPDWETLREAGRALKERTLRHLDDYLEQFEAAVQAAGGHVHWARDAGEANRIVAGLASDHGADEVVKVKSLASDEVGLTNAHLGQVQMIGGGNGLATFGVMLASIVFGFTVLSMAFRRAAPREHQFVRDILAPEVLRGTVRLEELEAALGKSARKAFRRSAPNHSARRARRHLRHAILDLTHDLAEAKGADTEAVVHARAEVARLRTTAEPGS